MAIDIANPGSQAAALRAAFDALPPTTESVTTGASSITADITKTLTLVTSGGTGVERINLPNFAFTIDGWATPEHNGTVHVIAIVALGDPGDMVRVDLGGSANVTLCDINGITVGTYSNGVPLNYLGASVTAVWQDGRWYLNGMSNNATDYPEERSQYIPPTGGLVPDLTYVLCGQQNNETPGWSLLPIPGTIQFVTTSATLLEVYPHAYATLVTSGGTGVEWINYNAAGIGSVGARSYIVFANAGDAGDTINLVPTLIFTEAGATIASIVFDTDGQYLVLEQWDTTTYRVVRGDATVTPA